LVGVAVNWEAKHTPQVDALQPGGGNLANQFRWNDLAAVRPAIQMRKYNLKPLEVSQDYNALVLSKPGSGMSLMLEGST
jgi:hypothetical protein